MFGSIAIGCGDFKTIKCRPIAYALELQKIINRVAFSILNTIYFLSVMNKHELLIMINVH